MRTKSIIQTAVLLITLCGVLSLDAQTHAIKGRLFGRPALRTHIFGIGYEAMLSPNRSIQILYNTNGYDWTATDGSAEVNRSIVPEYRIYFGKRLEENINRGAFIGLFNEFSFVAFLT